MLGCELVFEAVQQPAPAQVVSQILGGHTAKACHPGLQTGVVAVDALHMPRPMPSLAVVLRDKVARLHVKLLGHRPVSGVAVGTQHRICAQHRAQRFGQVRPRGPLQHLVKNHLGAALHRHDHSGLLGASAVFGLAAALF